MRSTRRRSSPSSVSLPAVSLAGVPNVLSDGTICERHRYSLYRIEPSKLADALRMFPRGP